MVKHASLSLLYPQLLRWVDSMFDDATVHHDAGCVLRDSARQQVLMVVFTMALTMVRSWLAENR